MATPNRVNHQHKVEEAPSEASNKAQAQARRQRACGVKGQSPLRSKFLVRLRSQEMGRASIGASLQAVQKSKRRNAKFLLIQCRNRRTKLHRFSFLLHNVKSAKSEAILRHGKVAHNCRGWRPRQPVSGSLKF